MPEIQLPEGATKIHADEFRKCIACRKPVLHVGNPVFYEIKVAQCISNPAAHAQLAGLAQTLGGGSRGTEVAIALSPNPHIAVRLAPETRWLCMDCGVSAGFPVAYYLETEK